MAKVVRIHPIFYNRLRRACDDTGHNSAVETEMEVVARVLDQTGPLISKFRDRWDHLDRLPTRGPQWRAADVTLDDRSLCVIAARGHPRLDDVVEIRDVALIPDPG